jgi:ABC-2 type transport system permease protein
MSRLLSAELLKMRTTRTFYGLSLGALALTVLISVAASLAGTFTLADRPVHDLVGVVALVQIFALVLGILAMTSETRHGTITPTLLTVPDRRRLVLAKGGAALGVGLALGLLAAALIVAIVLALLSIRGVDTITDAGDVVRAVIGSTLATGLYAALGVGLGALVRSQVGAVVGALVWLFLLEPLVSAIPHMEHAIATYGVGGVATGLSATGDTSPDTLAQLPAGLLLLGYCAVLTIAGIAWIQRRDVSA